MQELYASKSCSTSLRFHPNLGGATRILLLLACGQTILLLIFGDDVGAVLSLHNMNRITSFRLFIFFMLLSCAWWANTVTPRVSKGEGYWSRTRNMFAFSITGRLLEESTCYRIFTIVIAFCPFGTYFPDAWRRGRMWVGSREQWLFVSAPLNHWWDIIKVLIEFSLKIQIFVKVGLNWWPEAWWPEVTVDKKWTSSRFLN